MLLEVFRVKVVYLCKSISHEKSVGASIRNNFFPAGTTEGGGGAEDNI